MGRPSDWMREVTGRAPMPSPGAPGHQRIVERRFWDKVAEELLPTEAAVAVGVSPVKGTRWFRDAGGMSLYSWSPPGGRYLSFAEREEIALLRVQGKGVRQIAQALGRSPSTISRELRRNAATRSGKLDYRASVAQWRAELFARRPKNAKLLEKHQRRDYVQQRLAGRITDSKGRIAAGPRTGAWTGLIIGTDLSAIGTLVDRTTRFTILVHLPRERGWGKSAPVKNGSALSGYGALTMNKALSAALTKVPAQMLKSLTWDRGKELSAHAALTSKTGIPVFFADPHGPWQRGINENPNDILRQYCPKGTDLSRWTARDLAAVAHTLRSRSGLAPM